MTAGVAPLPASRDPETGQVYVPARRFSADGGLRECEAIEVAGTGLLRSWTALGDEHYGLIDLDSGQRIQARLVDGVREYGARYVLVDPDEMRFAHA